MTTTSISLNNSNVLKGKNVKWERQGLKGVFVGVVENTFGDELHRTILPLFPSK
jgi:hypothetical protein